MSIIHNKYKEVKKVCKEEYRDVIINGNHTNYQVSESGKVLNVVTNHYLTPTTNNSGRLCVCLSINGTNCVQLIHNLVYRAFIGDKPSEMTINHIDENFLHNHYTNLELMTREDNCREYRKNNGHPVKKYSDEVVRSICEALKSGHYFKDVAAAYCIPIQYVFNILKGKRRLFIVNDYLPFPESAHRRSHCRNIPKKYICSLILQGYSNSEILSILGAERTNATDKMFCRYRRELGIKDPKYFDKQFLDKVDLLIRNGLSNKEIYNKLKLKYTKRNQYMIARARQKLGILDFNPDGISLETQQCIMDLIRNGFTNADICKKYDLDRTPYVINMLGRLRQKCKKEGSTTIES